MCGASFFCMKMTMSLAQYTNLCYTKRKRKSEDSHYDSHRKNVP